MRHILFLIVFFSCNHLFLAQLPPPLAHHLVEEFKDAQKYYGKKIEETYLTIPDSESDAKQKCNNLFFDLNDLSISYYQLFYYQDFAKRLNAEQGEILQRYEENIESEESKFNTYIKQLQRKFGKRKVKKWLIENYESVAQTNFSNAEVNGRLAIHQAPKLNKRTLYYELDQDARAYLYYWAHRNLFELNLEELKDISKKDFRAQLKILEDYEEKLQPYHDIYWKKMDLYPKIIPIESEPNTYR